MLIHLLWRVVTLVFILLLVVGSAAELINVLLHYDPGKLVKWLPTDAPVDLVSQSNIPLHVLMEGNNRWYLRGALVVAYSFMLGIGAYLFWVEFIRKVWRNNADNSAASASGFTKRADRAKSAHPREWGVP